MEEVENNEKAESIVKEDEVDPKKAAEIVEREKKDRVNKCGKEIITVLQKYNCDFDISMILKQGSIMPNVQIVSK